MASTKRPDILFFFSDQHNGLYTGYGGHPVVETPNLDRLAAEGTVCESAYTSCPLCVPARSSMLTGQYPSSNGVFGNEHMIRSDQATFLHSLVEQGYETVLCGRMHFRGPDQRHGFTKRIFGDITTSGVGSGGKGTLFEEVGGEPLGRTFGNGGCLDIIGAGRSPVLEYDRAVVEAALNYLQEDHEKPQCILVGTYGPHFPYIAPPELFDYYRGKPSVPASWDREGVDPNPLLDEKRQRMRQTPGSDAREPVDEDVVLAARAAYFGMITEQDCHVGSVREGWQSYLERTGRDGVFVYSSDHGDTCGEHGIFGKMTFYEGSVRIPLVFEGKGIPAGVVISNPVSIMDIGPTLCDMAGASPPPSQEGLSLHDNIQNATDVPDRPVCSEWVDIYNGEIVPCRMIRRGKWKLNHYHHPELPDMLFNLEADPEELEDRAEERPDLVQRLMDMLNEDWEPERVAKEFEDKCRHMALIRKWNGVALPPEPVSEKWPVPEEAKHLPKVMI
jgi:choline-sulfatase